MLIKQQIDEIMELCKKATKGPWCFVEPKRNDGEGYSIYQTPGNYGQAITGWGQVTQTKENAEYIVAACNTFPELAQRVLELEAEVNRLQEIESCAEDVCEELEGHGLYAISRLTDVLTTPRGAINNKQVELNKQTNRIANLESQLAEAQKQNKKLTAVVEALNKETTYSLCRQNNPDCEFVGSCPHTELCEALATLVCKDLATLEGKTDRFLGCTALSQLQALCNVATPGPWEAEGVTIFSGANPVARTYDPINPNLATNTAKLNAQFFAAARNVLPDLLKENELLKGNIRTLTADKEHYITQNKLLLDVVKAANNLLEEFQFRCRIHSLDMSGNHGMTMNIRQGKADASFWEAIRRYAHVRELAELKE